MKAYRATFPLAAMCRVLGLSPSGYYDWLRRPPSARARHDAELKGRILAKWIDSDETYGCPRIHAALLADGERVSRKRVARLMKELDIEGVTRRRFKTGTTKRDAKAKPAPDLVNRDFSAKGPDRLWVADITYVPTWTGWLYLAVVLDTWSRRIVGWAMAPRMPAPAQPGSRKAHASSVTFAAYSATASRTSSAAERPWSVASDLHGLVSPQSDHLPRGATGTWSDR